MIFYRIIGQPNDRDAQDMEILSRYSLYLTLFKVLKSEKKNPTYRK